MPVSSMFVMPVGVAVTSIFVMMNMFMFMVMHMMIWLAMLPFPKHLTPPKE